MTTKMRGKTLGTLVMAGVVAGSLALPDNAEARRTRRGHISYGYPQYAQGFSYSYPYRYSSRYYYPYYYSSRYYSYPRYYNPRYYYPRYYYSYPYTYYYPYYYPYYW